MRADQGVPPSRVTSVVGVPHFQLVATDGTVLGTRELGRPDWPPGSVIYTGPEEPNLRVVDVLDEDEDDPERFKVLVGKPL
jgi:hypothetical protein